MTVFLFLFFLPRGHVSDIYILFNASNNNDKYNKFEKKGVAVIWFSGDYDSYFEVGSK